MIINASETIHVEKQPKDRLLGLIRQNVWDDKAIASLVPEWGKVAVNEGFTHNGDKLGEHTQKVVEQTRQILKAAGVRGQMAEAGEMAAFWHDMGKSTGGVGETVARDFNHEAKSVDIMRKTFEKWGIPAEKIVIIEKIILNDSIVSDIARGKVREPGKNLEPAQLAEALGGDLEICQVLRAVNQADVLATVGQPGWEVIQKKYNAYFDQVEKIMVEEKVVEEMRSKVTEKFGGNEPKNMSERLRKLWFDAMEVVDTVKCLPFLGGKDAKNMAGFSRLMREEGEKFEMDRWLGIGYGVDKTLRKTFLALIRDNNSGDLRKLIKVARGMDASRVFTYDYWKEKDGLAELIKDDKLMDFGSKLEGFNVLAHIASDSRPGSRLKENLELIGRSQFGDKLLLDETVIDKLLKATTKFEPHEVGPMFALENFPAALEYIKNSEKGIRADMIPLLEFASLDAALFDQVKRLIDQNPSHEIFMSKDMVRKAQELVATSDNLLIKKVMGMAGKEINYLLGEWDIGLARSEYYSSKIQRVWQTVGAVSVQMTDRQLSQELVDTYLDSFPIESWDFEKAGWIVRSGENLLDKFTDPDVAQVFMVGRNKFGELNFLVARLAMDIEKKQNITFPLAYKEAEKQFEKPEMVARINKGMWSFAGEYLNQRPEQITDAIRLFSEEQVMLALSPGGVLGDSTEVFCKAAFGRENVYGAGMDIVMQFNRPATTYWEKAYFFAVNANQTVLEGRTRFVKVRYVGINDDGDFVRTENGEYTDFATLAPEQKRGALKATLKEAVERTRSNEEKEIADSRNRQLADSDQLKVDGVRLHGTDAASLPRILRSGILAGECVSKLNEVDAYPFCVDYAVVGKREAEQLEFGGVYKSKEKIYGTFFDKGVVLMFVPSEEAASTLTGSEHVLKFAAETATNMSGIILTQSVDRNLETKKMEIAENGFYIPIYSKDGKKLFSAEEYDQLRRDYHLNQALEYWDGSLKIGDALGSNPGGTYLVPGSEGPKKYYAKQPGNRDWVWSEWLSNQMYSDFGVAVPITEVRNADGRLAVTSRWIESGDDVVGEIRPLNDGFIMDAWLANWDIPNAADRNTLKMGDGVVRMDNGGAGLFRARGELRDVNGGENPFTEKVVELEIFRNKYAGLTDQEIRDQATKLGQVFTDAVIDNRVEQTQMAPELREILKLRLKQRRDFILTALNVKV